MVIGSVARHSDQENLEGITARYNLHINVIGLSETSCLKQVLQCTE